MDKLAIILKGLLMGTVDVIRGVSGGTIALVTGIYARFIAALANINLVALRLVLTRQWREAWSHTDAGFLLLLAFGMFLGAISFSHVVGYSLLHFPHLVWALFFGLILQSTFLLLSKVEQWSLLKILFFMLGFIIVVGLGFLEQRHTTELATPYAMFLPGMIATSVMILPGISGSFVLVVMGKYETLITALNNLDFMVLGVFFLGNLVGMLLAVRIVRWLFQRMPYATYAFLCGLMLGSLPILWPWKISESESMSLFASNLLPAHYLADTGANPQIFFCIILALLGGFLVQLLWRLSPQ